jgi:hypothetical protein
MKRARIIWPLLISGLSPGCALDQADARRDSGAADDAGHAPDAGPDAGCILDQGRCIPPERRAVCWGRPRPFVELSAGDRTQVSDNRASSVSQEDGGLALYFLTERWGGVAVARAPLAVTATTVELAGEVEPILQQPISSCPHATGWDGHPRVRRGGSEMLIDVSATATTCAVDRRLLVVARTAMGQWPNSLGAALELGTPAAYGGALLEDGYALLFVRGDPTAQPAGSRPRSGARAWPAT